MVGGRHAKYAPTAMPAVTNIPRTAGIHEFGSLVSWTLMQGFPAGWWIRMWSTAPSAGLSLEDRKYD
ncbi:hypothetical protein Pen02_82240 [Plantactinospora endophytica]|uniref:Uncharacterized protein n=1 Tax=Plantactinospora endophytica TaxID=673535 RepID=A0ABQ4EEY8_9ACTN|nr:hypothetical protein Pen02_82240 [Plantactinospora endophytica]